MYATSILSIWFIYYIFQLGYIYVCSKNFRCLSKTRNIEMIKKKLEIITEDRSESKSLEPAEFFNVFFIGMRRKWSNKLSHDVFKKMLFFINYLCLVVGGWNVYNLQCCRQCPPLSFTIVSTFAFRLTSNQPRSKSSIF